ncbi:MAG: AI-2E family transporter [Clostridia bacterium]|nr:AI-2E family transporter [Clostridia bacterium]
MEKNKDDLKRIFKIVLFAAIIFWGVSNVDIVMGFLNNFIEIISPFILGGFLAFIINIPMAAIEKRLLKTRKNKKTGKEFQLNKKLARALSLILSLIFIAFILFGIVTLVVPELINVIKLLIEKVPYYAEKVQLYLQNSDETGKFIEEVLANIEINPDTIKNDLLKVVSGVLSSSVSFVGATFGVIIDSIISIVFAAYILVSKEKLLNQFDRLFKAYLSPKWYKRITKISNLTKNTFSTFFSVQCIEATILGLLCVLGMLILKIPYAVTVGVFVGVTALIPVVGAFIGIIIGAILIVSVEPIKVITFIIFVLILQQVETNLIYPKVVGDMIGLPGIWVLVAVSVGGSLFGLVGMLLGVPVTSVIYTLLRENVNERLSK